MKHEACKVIICNFAARNCYASLAQLVEQLTRNEQVGGSSPLRGSRELGYLK